MKKKILFIIPRGEVIRNFAYTGIINQLRNIYELHLLSVIPSYGLEEYLKEVSDELDELKPQELTYFHGYLLSLLDLAHNRYLWSEAARVRWNMRDVESVSCFSKIKRVVNKILATMLANNSAIRILESLVLRLSKTEFSVKYYINYFKNIQPDLVFSGSHSHASIAYPAIQAARIMGIHTATFLFSWDNLTSQGRVIPPFDYYIAWNQKIRDDFFRIYPDIIKDSVFVTGTPQFICHFEKSNYLPRSQFLGLLGLQSHEEYVLYSAGMSHHMPHEPEIVLLLADLLATIQPNLKLVVRTYAKDKAEVFNQLKDTRPDIIIPVVKWEKNFQTPLLEDQIFFTNLLLHCELGVNVASTISLELCMFDKPAINIGFNPPGRNIYPYDYSRFYAFDHYKPIVESGAVEVANNLDDLKSMIIDSLNNPLRLKDERFDLISKFFEGNLGVDVNQNFIDVFNRIFNKIK